MVFKRMTGFLFSKGKRVEVSLEQVENCEVWFPAVVEEETGNDFFVVEYQCLGKNGVTESVRVKVDFLHLRPSPPQFVKNYDLLEKVDAYIDYGWWSGVITKELPDSKYLIFFKKTNEQRTVNQSEIRPHMEWKEGNWFSASQDLLASPEYQGPAKTAMDLPGGLGTVKENSAIRAATFFNSLDIRNEWLAPSNIEPSTVMTSQRKKSKLLSPNTDEQTIVTKLASVSDHPHLSTENMNSSLVRITSEEIHFGCTTLTDGGSRTNNLEQLMGDQLLNRSPRTTQRKRARSKVRRGKPVKLKSSQYSPRGNAGKPQTSPTSETRALAGEKVVSELDNHTSEPLVKNNEMLPIAHLSGRKTSEDKKLDVGCIKEHIEGECVTEVPATHNSEYEVVDGSESNKLPLTAPEEMVEPMVEKEQQLHDPAVNVAKEDDQLEGHKEIIGKRKRGRQPKKLGKILELNQKNVDKKLEKIPEISQQNEGKELEKCSEIIRQNGGVAITDMEVGCIKERIEGECVTEVPASHNFEYVVEGSKSSKLPLTPPDEMVEPMVEKEQQLHDPAVNVTKEDDQLERHKEIIGKRKRGGQPKKLGKFLELSQENVDKKLKKIPEISQQNEGKKLEKSSEISRQNGGVAIADMEVVLPVVVGLKAAQVHGSVSNNKKLGIDEIILKGSSDQSRNEDIYPLGKDKLQSGKVLQASVDCHEKDSSERGLRRSIRIHSKSPNQDPKDARVEILKATGRDSLVKEAETSLTFILSEDDQPLSMWMGSPKAANATCSSRRMNMEPCFANRSPEENVMLSPQSDESLPFVKSCPLWKTIESMEVFRQLPQRPHFQSLGSEKENSREGLAIASMVDFVGVVKKTSTLQFNDPRSTIEANLDTLIDLEKHGFNVKVIQDRLLSLLLIKEKHDELQNSSKKTTDQINEKNHDMVKIDEKIAEIDNQIRSLQEERALILSTKEEKDLNVASLEATLNDISSSIKNVELEFGTLVAAPWQAA